MDSSKKALIRNRLNEKNVGDRSSLFEIPLTSPAIRKTIYSGQLTAEYNRAISKESTKNIPGRMLPGK